MAERIYLSTTIPYVNARPHLGFALELVQADALARHHRQRGDLVRFQTGTDENSLKNVLAAQAEGVPVRELVRRNAAAFAELAGPLALSYDDFIQTSSDPRHLAGAQRLWRACAERGDLVPQGVPGPVLRRLRAVLPGCRAGRGPLPRAWHRRAAGVGAELVLPAVAVRRGAARPGQLGPAAGRAGRPPERGARVHRLGP